jgi:hypothetical protein
MEGTVEVGDGLEIAFNSLRIVTCVTVCSFGVPSVPVLKGSSSCGTPGVPPLSCGLPDAIISRASGYEAMNGY